MYISGHAEECPLYASMRSSDLEMRIDSLVGQVEALTERLERAESLLRANAHVLWNVAGHLDET